jgi:hypothetical protein
MLIVKKHTQFKRREFTREAIDRQGKAKAILLGF